MVVSVIDMLKSVGRTIINLPSKVKQWMSP